MRSFKAGDVGYVVDRDGREAEVRVMGEQGNGSYFVMLVNGHGLHSGSPFLVQNEKLLAPRGPFFDIRGQVITTSPTHLNEIGQIVGTATSKSGKIFFNVCFDDGKCEWLNEDQVFIDDEAKRNYDEAADRV